MWGPSRELFNRLKYDPASVVSQLSWEVILVLFRQAMKLNGRREEMEASKKVYSLVIFFSKREPTGFTALKD